MTQLYRQIFLLFFENFTTIEEAVIAWAYSVITILKLRPNNKYNQVSYSSI